MASNNPKVEFYRDGSMWRWRVRANNDKIIGASTESYHNKSDAMKNFVTLTGRQIVDETSAGDWTVFGLR